MDTSVSLFLLEDLGINNSISGLILSNNLLYDLCSFVWELVHLKKFLIIYRAENNISLYMAYMFLNEVHANKLVPHSELMIFIRYENNSYYFYTS